MRWREDGDCVVTGVKGRESEIGCGGFYYSIIAKSKPLTHDQS